MTERACTYMNDEKKHNMINHRGANKVLYVTTRIKLHARKQKHTKKNIQYKNIPKKKTKKK